jgi:hypothetical protein
MGYEDQASAAAITYFCEVCRPELYPALRKPPRRASASTSASPPPPTKPQKRRNTMNSRVDDSIEDLIAATAAEAEAAAHAHEPADDEHRAKRKRSAEDDAYVLFSRRENRTDSIAAAW